MKKPTKKEKKIFDAIMKAFPATSKCSAYGTAIEGGAILQFYPK